MTMLTTLYGFNSIWEVTDGRGIALCKSVPSPLNPVRELRELHISATESDSGKGMKILFFYKAMRVTAHLFRRIHE